LRRSSPFGAIGFQELISHPRQRAGALCRCRVDRCTMEWWRGNEKNQPVMLVRFPRHRTWA